MRGIILAVPILIAGCSGQARTDYYLAIAEANRAEAAAYQAKADALKAVAEADPTTAGAVAMALALSSARTVAPSYIEDEGLSYTKALAGPIAAIGGAFIAADVAKQGIKSNERVQIQASQASSNTLVGIADAISAGNAASNQAIVDVANAPTPNVVDAEFAQAALSTVETVATGSQDSLVTVANTGLTTAEGISGSGMQTVMQVAETGLDSTVTLGTAGLDTATTLSLDANQTLETVTLDNNNLVETLSTNLQPIVPLVEITPVEIVPVVEVTPIATPVP